ncbi:RHS repeat-associated core domain-containing protein [Blastopirellula retiformator]|uniref:Teneurin-like YD-shell domain-containing protein n=1 Tax=Blastopirellula retiformator TaxID=2527970 RepID=A0A5C5UTC0_9BACT|nr:RHS repeat-associated core domain-containing protein [Blastopirellula retiformator]TWT29631.1 hypothetical protein Enr8_48190 [Blastopirellula retiformator]
MLQLDSTGDVDHRMLWGAAVDQILADENDAGDVHWMLTDNQNTVRDIAEYDDATDTTSIVNHIAYSVFGEVTSQTNSSLDTLPFYYTARYFDEATGLQYNTNRWYNPELNRWMSQDPIGFEAGDANLYRYVGNGHLNGVDPSGLDKSDTNEEIEIKGDGFFLPPVSWPIKFLITAFSGEASRSGVLDKEIMDLQHKRANQQGNLDQVFHKNRFLRSNELCSDMEGLAHFGVESQAAVLGGGFLRPSGGLTNVVEESSDSFGRWFARYGDDGAETFSARLLNGADELGIAWTDDVAQLAGNIAEIQCAGGRNITKIKGLASDGIEKLIKAGRFNSDLYAKQLSRKLGGTRRIDVVKRTAQDAWDITATRIGN